MFRIKETVTKEDNVINMRDLKPCEIARIIDPKNYYFGDIVMRTAHDEVMSLSKPGKNNCWTIPVNLLVERLKKGDEITLVVI